MPTEPNGGDMPSCVNSSTPSETATESTPTATPQLPLIEIKNRFSGAVIYSERHATIKDAVISARNISADLRSADLSSANLISADLRSADLSSANLSGANLSGANLPSGFRVAHLCFGGWPVTITAQHTAIGCQRHDNDKWLAWLPDDVSHMHSQAESWWKDHGEAVKAVIRNVMQIETANTGEVKS